MNNLINAASCFMLVFIFAQSPLGWADMFDFQKLLSGTVTDVRPDSITLAPNQTDELEAKTVDLKINEKTQLTDIGILANLKKGDGIQVKYVEDQGQNVAVEISKGTPAETMK